MTTSPKWVLVYELWYDAPLSVWGISRRLANMLSQSEGAGDMAAETVVASEPKHPRQPVGDPLNDEMADKSAPGVDGKHTGHSFAKVFAVA